MKLEYGITSTVAHDPIGKSIKKRKVSAKTGSTEKLASQIKAIKKMPRKDKAGRVATKKDKASGIRSLRKKQAKRANWQHEG